MSEEQERPEFVVNIAWMRIIMPHFFLTIIGLLTLAFLAFAGTLDVRNAITVGLGLLILMVAHLFAFALPSLRSGLAVMEYDMKHGSSEKRKRERLELGEDGELVSVDELMGDETDEDDAAYSAQESRRQSAR